MISHPALTVHPNPESVLIIGGGDGAVIGEALKHKSVKRVVLVEIDKMVVEASKQFFPQFSHWNDPRLTVHFADGAKYLLEHPGDFDVVIVDSSDPVGMDRYAALFPFPPCIPFYDNTFSTRTALCLFVFFFFVSVWFYASGLLLVGLTTHRSCRDAVYKEVL